MRIPSTFVRSLLTLSLACFAADRSLAADSTAPADAKLVKPLQAGAPAPDATLKNSLGADITLASLHQKGPVVLVFFRGGWCPICTRHTQALIKAHPQVQELGAQIVAISPDDTEHSRDNATKHSIPFPVLSDPDVRTAKAFGLAFRVDDETFKKYKSFGIDLEKASGRTHHILPVPAVFIVNKAGKITFAHSNPDYRERLDAGRIVEELKKLR